MIWDVAVGGRLSPPVIANGKLFVTSIDQHRVFVFDAVSGEARWSFTAGGRIDTPPTIYKGLVIFGSADGWAYCLRESDGQLAWRRRAAPRERLLGAFDQLESAWPVNGSILVKDDVAYLAAGRSSYLDSGIYLSALDPITGKVLNKQVLYSPEPDTGKMPSGDARTIPGVLADILVSDGTSIYMRQEKVFAQNPRGKPHLLATAGFRDDNWFNRTQWVVGAVARAQLLVFDERMVYGIEAYPTTKRWNFFRPGEKGYLLFAVMRKSPSSSNLSGSSDRGSAKKKKLERLWAIRVPVRATAMVLANKVLFAAGPPDVVDPKDPLGAFEGRKGGVLSVFDKTDGKKLWEYVLPSPPVFNGLAAANGRLYVTMQDGSVACFGK
ncbi:MAG: outer membrane protein assembly factor BamB family protein [Planctomycetota bacterium]